MDFNAIPIKISAGLFVQNHKVILKFILICRSLKEPILVHWEDPEGWDGEGGGRGDRDGEHM